MTKPNWSTIKHRANNIVIGKGPQDELDLRPIHAPGSQPTGTTIGPSLKVQVGADGHELYDWVWPTDAAYIASAERFAYRRQSRKGQL